MSLREGCVWKHGVPIKQSAFPQQWQCFFDCEGGWLVIGDNGDDTAGGKNDEKGEQ